MFREGGIVILLIIVGMCAIIGMSIRHAHVSDNSLEAASQEIVKEKTSP
jgi:hypothetical protein